MEGEPRGQVLSPNYGINNNFMTALLHGARVAHCVNFNSKKMKCNCHLSIRCGQWPHFYADGIEIEIERK